MADEPKKGLLSKMFNLKSIAKFAMWTIPLFLGATVGTEIISFVWGHESTGGQALIKAVTNPLTSFFENSGINEFSHSAANWITETFNTSSTDIAMNNPHHAAAADELVNQALVDGLDLNY